MLAFAGAIPASVPQAAFAGADTGTDTGADTGADGLEICVVVPHFKDEYWLSVAYGLEEEARRTGTRLWTYESGGYLALARQVELLDLCLQRGADAILLAAVSVDDPVLLDSVARASEQVPVLALVNELHSPDLAGEIGVDWRQMGAAIGRFLAGRHPDGGRPAEAVLISGPRESGWAPLVEAGLLEAVEGSGLRIVDIRRADTGLREQIDEVGSALSQRPDIDYLIGSAPAVEAAMGLLTARPRNERPQLLATYISHSIRRGLRRDRVLAVPFDDPVRQGRLGMQLAIEAAKGRPRAGLSDPGIGLVTSTTLPAGGLPLSPAGFLPEIQ